MRKIRFGSLRFRTGGRNHLLELLASGRSGSGPRRLGYMKPHVYNMAASHPCVGEFLEHCEFVCMDGVGAVLAGSLQNGTLLTRQVMDQVFDAAVSAGLVTGSVLLFGLTQKEIEGARDFLSAASLAMRIIAYEGFLPDAEYADILRRHADADFVLSGMGTPRSERILSLAAGICGHAWCWHVGGGTLRNWAGTKKRAPRILSRLGMEWLHRVIHEPTTRSRYGAGIAAFARRFTFDAVHAGRRSPAADLYMKNRTSPAQTESGEACVS
jgi:N-acetylglucosaminyldiphosphoundecaprenol N-acetyl-beta-D-mannosaminyltransferase